MNTALPLPSRPSGLRASLAIHSLVFASFFVFQHYYLPLTVPVEEESIQVIVIGDIDSEITKQGSRSKIHISDMKNGLILADGVGGRGKAAMAKGLGALASSLGNSPTLSRKIIPGKPETTSGRTALAALATEFQRDLIGSQGQGNGQGTQPSIKSLTSLPAKMDGVEWKKIEGLEMQSQGNLSDKDVSLVRQKIGAQSLAVRDCYEKALLQDRDISGKVDFLFKVGAKGALKGTKVNFSGTGQESSVEALRGCLSSLFGALSLPAHLLGIEFKMSFRVKS